MNVHLVDGTYELFRHFYGAPSHLDERGEEVGAIRGVLSSTLSMLEGGVTHLGVATDHVIESFRNELWPGYKDGGGVDPLLWGQAGRLEDALGAMGVVVWPMVELEADDALASAAAVCADDPRVEQVVICTPDKDLGQCVSGSRVVQLDRRKRLVIDEAGVVERFGVLPASIPDYLALVGDSADGFPGLPGWGARSAASVLARWGKIEAIPDDPADWEVRLRGSQGLAATLRSSRQLAALFVQLATLRVERGLLAGVDELCWRGPDARFASLAAELGIPAVAERTRRLAATRADPAGPTRSR
jgi:5'-3' exonuclease